MCCFCLFLLKLLYANILLIINSLSVILIFAQKYLCGKKNANSNCV